MAVAARSSYFSDQSAARGCEADRCCAIVVQVVLALSFIHARGVMHRDLKCSNIFIHNQKLLKLGDFGLVKVLDAPAGPYSSSGSLAGAVLSSSGLGTAAAMVSQNAGLMAQSFVGTPNYLAPEVVNCEPYNLKADCWALGCVLYEMAALKPAFKVSVSIICACVRILCGDSTSQLQ